MTPWSFSQQEEDKMGQGVRREGTLWVGRANLFFRGRYFSTPGFSRFVAGLRVREFSAVSLMTFAERQLFFDTNRLGFLVDREYIPDLFGHP